jgi:cardiolipin synthase
VNAPNLISLARLLSVPVALWLITTGAYGAAFWLFVAAGVSDGVDGYLAKRLGQRTELGRYLDPLADKVLLVSVYVVLGIQDQLPSWLVILVVARDLLIVGCSALALMMSQSVKIQPLLISKLNTFAQIVLAAVTLAMLGLGIGDRLMIDILIYIVAATTLLSGACYLFKWASQNASVENIP